MMDVLKRWLQSSKMDRKSVAAFLRRMKKATAEYTGNAIILRHPKEGTWVVTKYGAVFVAPKDTCDYIDREEQITLITSDRTELTIDLHTGRLIKVCNYQSQPTTCQA